MPRSFLAIATGAIVLITAGAPALVRAQVNEAELKAAFVFNFVAFVAWPAGDRASGDDLLICARAGSALENALVGLNRKRVGTRRIVTKLLRAPGDTDRCDVIVADFPQTVVTAVASIGTVTAPTAELIEEQAAAWPDGWWRQPGVLSVADGGDAERNGAVITLVRENARVGFDVDTVAAERAGLDLSSKLLRLARRVL